MVADALLDRLTAAARTRQIVTSTGRMTWRCFGEGPILVLFHGGHGSWLHWARNIETLAAHHEVWVPDLPGYGDSDPPADGTFDGLIDVTVEALDELGGPNRPVRLVGFSFGGLVAAKIAGQRAGVTHLALFGPAGHGGPRRPKGALLPWRDLVPYSEEWNVVMRHNLLMHMLHEPAAVDDLALRIHGGACLATRFHSKPISRAGGLAACLERHAGPLLLASGEHDVTLVQATLNAFADSHSNCRTHVVPGVGHWAPYEAADATNDLLASWLAAN